MRRKQLILLIRALRPNQWIKNLILFATIIFNGQLFNWNYLLLTTGGFFIFCALSSSSYLFNDIVDLRLDRIHPQKKNRPLASGLLSLSLAIEVAFLLAMSGLISALFFNFMFFLVAASFTMLHVGYSLFL